MHTKCFQMALSLFLLTMVICANDDEYGTQLQLVQEQNLSLLKKEYKNLFFSDIENLFATGKSGEAVKIIKNTIDRVIQTDWAKNEAFKLRTYYQVRDLEAVPESERFQPNYLLPLGVINFGKTIENLTQDLDLLEKERLKRKNELELLNIRSNPKMKEEKVGFLVKKTENNKENVKLLQYKLSIMINEKLSNIEASEKEFWQNVLKELDEFNFDNAIQRYAFLRSPYTLSEKFPENIADWVRSIKEKLDAVNQKITETINILQQIKNLNNPIRDSERETSEQIKKTQQNFEQDTDQQKDLIQKKINFLKLYPNLWEITSIPRHQQLGLTEDFYCARSEPLGEGIIIGVIDVYPELKFSSPVLSQCVNSDCLVSTFDMNSYQSMKKSGSLSWQHGIHVAGIATCPENESHQVGVAPQAKFQIIDANDDIPGPAFSTTGEYTLDKMMELVQLWVSQFDGNPGDDAKIKPLFSAIRGSKIVTSNARIFNYSISQSTINRFYRSSNRKFAGGALLFEFALALQDGQNILVVPLGNDGLLASSSPNFNVEKALSRLHYTKESYIAVTNLMEDGRTLNPTSSVPGDDIDLYKRTLSAVGTNVMSTLPVFEEGEPVFGLHTGTSMAAPQVSGIAALVLSRHPHISGKELAKALLEGATPLIDIGETFALALEDITAKYLNDKLQLSPQGIQIDGYTITPEVWERSQKLYGQGRVNYKGALEVLEDIR